MANEKGLVAGSFLNKEAQYDIPGNWQHTARTNPQVQTWYNSMRQSHPGMPTDVVQNMIQTPVSNYNYPLAINMGMFPTQQKSGQYHWSDVGKGPDYGNTYGLPASLIKAESSGNPKAKAGSHIGLMQVGLKTSLVDYNTEWGTNYTAKDLLNPTTNQTIGNWYLGQKIPKVLSSNNMPVNVYNIIWAYHDGPYAVKEGRVPSVEAQNEIAKVQSLMKEAQLSEQ